MSPIRLSKKTLEDAELNLGTAYSGQYLQDPQVIGGRFFKESWPRYYKPQQMPAFESIIISGDTAFTGKHCNTSLQLWGYKAPDAYLLKDQTELMNNEQTEACLIRLYESCPGCTMVIEQASSGFTILQNLSKKYRVFSFIPQKFGGKEVRATSTASMWWQGHVWLPDEPYYRTTYMEEFLNFPAGAKDRVDSASQALIYFSVLLPGKSQLLHLSHDNIVSDNYVLMGQPNKG
jgi:predicted phage terminase large subunit-like protein